MILLVIISSEGSDVDLGLLRMCFLYADIPVLMAAALAPQNILTIFFGILSTGLFKTTVKRQESLSNPTHGTECAGCVPNAA